MPMYQGKAVFIAAQGTTLAEHLTVNTLPDYQISHQTFHIKGMSHLAVLK
jgi:hypothetical protein